MNLQDLLPALVAVAIFILVAFPIQEFSHAWAAFRLGDSTARWQGRLTLNPVVHFDPLGGGMLILTTVLGIVGALVATYLGQAVGWYEAGQGAGLIGAIVGAVIVLLIWGVFTRGRTTVT